MNPPKNWPGEKGLLKEPMELNGVEIIRPFDGTAITTALFDFDGTLSLERVWIDLMVRLNSSQLHKATNLPLEVARDIVIKDVEETYGVPTIICMDRLVSRIREFGGKPNAAEFYKNVYTAALAESVDLRRRTIPKDDLTVFGSKEFLSLIKEKLGENIFLASGTDIAPVIESINFLGFSSFFPRENIKAAGSLPDPRADPKKFIIDSLVKEKNLSFGQLVTFGDGFPELLHNNYGVRVAVLTPNLTRLSDEGRFTLEEKRQRLIYAGAHVIVNDFSNPQKLLEIIFSSHYGETL